MVGGTVSSTPKISSKLHKELQRTAAFRAYNDHLVSTGDSMGAQELKDKLRDLYLGNKEDTDNIGYVEQLVNGLQSFEPMFDRVEELEKGMAHLGLKKCFHCTPTDIVSDPKSTRSTCLNMKMLKLTNISSLDSNKNKKTKARPHKTAEEQEHDNDCEDEEKGGTAAGYITARSLWKFAKVVEANGKKALAIIQRSPYRDGNMPSGETYDSYLRFLRESMFQVLNKCDIADDEEDQTSVAASGGSTPGGSGADSQEDKNNDEGGGPTKKKMEDSYMFPGFIAFALWGPLQPPDAVSGFDAVAFQAGDDPNSGKDGGRAAIRNKKKEEQQQAIQRLRRDS